MIRKIRYGFFVIMLFILGCSSKVVKIQESENKSQAINVERVLNKSEPNKTGDKSAVDRKKSPPVIQTGRYTAVKMIPTDAQSNLLGVMIKVTIPQQITTINGAVHYLLRRSGYQVSSKIKQNKQVMDFLAKPLPDAHRKIGSMRLIDALEMLASPAYEVLTDPAHRELIYRLKPNFDQGATL